MSEGYYPDASTSTSPFSIAENTRVSLNHEWYWGKVPKEAIAGAMEGAPDGTFAVRDASTQDGYTLTLRIGGANKLIRIVANGTKCGFTTETCDFNFLHELIQFYSKHSLRGFNDLLDIQLLYPLRKPPTIGDTKAPKPPARCESVRLPLHVVKCQLEGLHAEFERVSRHFDQLFVQKATLSDECQRLRRIANAYSDSSELYSKAISELRTAIATADKSENEALKGNIELQEGRMSDIEKARKLIQDSLEEVEFSLVAVDKGLESLKPRLLSLHRKRDERKNELIEHYKANKEAIQSAETLLREVAFNLDVEPTNLTEFLLLKAPLKWNPFKWMARDGDKASAMKCVQTRMEQKAKNGEESDGIFLIRPSQSKEGFYALVISMGGEVHNCLVEYSGDKADYGGYAFHNTNIYFSTLVDFVRYYSIISLCEHNEQLDTRLVTPAYD